MEPLKILFIGDSLTEGYGIKQSQAYPSLVAEMLEEELERPIEIFNGSVSGSTTSSGLSRINWFKRSNPDIVLLALGANDGLRGVPIHEIKNNYLEMIEELKNWDCKIIIAGMKLPPNYAQTYRTQFEDIF